MFTDEEILALKAKIGSGDRFRGNRGPWDLEPDEKWFVHRGVNCCVIRHLELGSWCGYVRVLPGHKWFGDIDVYDAQVHGGITYTERHAPGREPNPNRIEWWIGFDCAHLFDVVPSMAVYTSEDPRAEYRGFEYVKLECMRLVDQMLDVVKP